MREVLDSVFNEMIDVILLDFGDDEKGIIIDGYKRYLEINYRDSVNLENISLSKQVILKMEHIKWDKSDKKEKQVSLIFDENLRELGKISALAQDYANYKLMGKEDLIDLTVEEMNHKIELMEKYRDLVKPFNKEIANSYFSEAVVDFQYALGLSNNTSFRIGKIF